MSVRPQNLVVIMSDEHDPRYLGASGHPLVRTPNIDRLAARGRRFARTYTPSPICVPARAAVATGRYVHDIGYWDNSLAYDGRVPSWGHALQQAGIRVESIGKLHYGGEDLSTGFDRQHLPMHVRRGHGVWGSIRDPLPVIVTKERMLGSTIGAGESAYTRFDRATAARAALWLREAAAAPEQGPWVLFVGFVAPHFPLIAPQEFVALYPVDRVPRPKLRPEDGFPRHPWAQAMDDFFPHDGMFESDDERMRAIATYYALCSYLDSNVGKVLDAIEAAGLSDATRVIYTSDHGDNLGARGLWGKSTMYEESVAVPMILAGTDVAPGVVETPVSLLDLYPTILDAAGARPTDLVCRPGRSLFAVPDPDRTIFSEYHAVGAVSGAFMVRWGRWKYNHYVGFRPELFDLESDPEELIDLAGEPWAASVLDEGRRRLLAICDPNEVDAAAKAAQSRLVESFGGRDRALSSGNVGATPPPAA
jgi:choline-sulfatase